MPDQVISTLVVDIKGRDVGLAALLAKVRGELAKAKGDADGYTKATAPIAPAQDKAARSALAMAQAQARLAAVSGDTAGGIAKLRAGIDQLVPGSLAAVRAQAQLVQMENRLQAESTGTAGILGKLKGELGGMVGSFGAATLGIGGITAALGVASAAMLDAADRAREITQSLGDLSPAEVEAVSAAAVTLGQRYGADLQGQLDATRQLMIAFGLDGQQATDVIAAGFQRGLNVSDDYLDTLREYSPFFAQLGLSADDALGIIQRGMEAGARNTDYIGDAVKELNIRLRDLATAGKLDSLDSGMAAIVRQFQNGEISAAQAFQAISDGLAQIDDATTRNAVGVELFGTKYEDLQGTAVGAMLDLSAGTEGAAGATDALNAHITSLGEIGPRVFGALGQALGPINQGLIDMSNNLLDVLNTGSRMETLNAQIFAGAASYDAYAAAVAASNAETGAQGEHIAMLTAEQYAYAQSLVATGTSTQDAVAAAQALAGALITSGSVSTALQERWDGNSEAAAALSAQMVELASQSDANNATVLELANAYLTGEISAAQLATQLNAMSTAAEADAARSAEAEAATLAKADADAAAAQASAEHEAAVRASGIAQLEAGVQSELLAQKQDALKAAVLEAAAAGGSAEAAAKLIASQFDGVEAPAVINLINLHRELAAARANAAAKQVTRNAAVDRQEFSSRGVRAAYGESQQIAAASAAVASSAKPTAPKPRAGRGGGGGGGGGKSDAQQRAEEEQKYQQQRLKDAEKVDQQLRDAERAHYTKLLDIQRAYEEKSLAQQRKNEVSKRQSKADFYDALTQAAAGEDAISQETAAQLSAAYEQAYADAQTYAQEGKQQLAADYLALKQEQIQAELEYQQKIAAAQEAGNKAEVARLQAIEQMRREARQAELDALLAGGDANVNARDAAMADEGQRYAEDQAKVGDAAEQAGQRKVTAAQQSQAAIEAETAALRQQADLLDQVNAKRLAGQGAPGAPAAAPAAASGPSSPAAAGPSSPAASGGAMPVSAPDVVSAVGALGEAIAAVERAVRALGDRPNYAPGA